MVEANKFLKACAFIYVAYLVRCCCVLGVAADVNDGWCGGMMFLFCHPLEGHTIICWCDLTTLATHFCHCIQCCSHFQRMWHNNQHQLIHILQVGCWQWWGGCFNFLAWGGILARASWVVPIVVMGDPSGWERLFGPCWEGDAWVGATDWLREKWSRIKECCVS